TSWNFTAMVSNPNGSIDQYPANNVLKAAYTSPPEYVSDIIFECRTNLMGQETYYELRDGSGNIIFSRSNLASSTTYHDTLHLAPGCYSFRMIDGGKDGLAWWANNSGTGWMRLKSGLTGVMFKNFVSDFGTEIYQEFTVGYSIGISEPQIETALQVYPNPTEGNVTVDFQSPDEQVELLVFDFTGKLISDQQINTEHTMRSVNVDLSGNAAGIYFVQMRSSEGVRTAKVIKE
ncbi:MAG TPA: T9SS type A sorting domain-containing protein, partial [Bacteroidia bacterium]|nr:T9SS type A sorting domain-containing protein [Bacteroidia bacterium]